MLIISGCHAPQQNLIAQGNPLEKKSGIEQYACQVGFPFSLISCYANPNTVCLLHTQDDEERRGITLPYPPHSVSRTVQYFLSSPDFSSPKWEKNIHLKSEYIMISVQTDADCYGAESCVLNTCMCSMWTSREQHAVAAYGSYMYVHQIHVITSQFSLDTILVM